MPLGAATRAAEAGLDGVFMVDHLFPPSPDGPDRPSLEVFSTLAAVAAQHQDLTVGTLVARVTLRPAAMLARQTAAIAAMRPWLRIRDGDEPGAPGSVGDTGQQSRPAAGGMIVGIGTGDRASREEHRRYGIELPDVAERLQLLEDTAGALRALYAGRAWPGGEAVPPIAGPLLPAASPAIWVGGRSDAVVAIAARVADAWNGWGLDADSFSTAAARLRAWSADRDQRPRPTWGGPMLVGQDRADLDRLMDERERTGRSSEGAWVGTAAELRAFGDQLREAGASWCIALPLGPTDRLSIIAEALAA
jgi:alkanesulfonate monooxygenase SsuD/methylene tetrahydromethanopterin reductase-like flavin-dependent oxidoreductase (luciferase family)